MGQILKKLEDPNRPLLGPNVKALKFWGLLLPDNVIKRYFYILMHILITLFAASEYVDIYFIKSNIKLVLNNVKITMLATMSVCKVTTFLAWQNNWKEIIDYVVRADLNLRKNAEKAKIEIIENYTRYCRKITYFYWFLMYTTVVIVVLNPIFKYFFSESYRQSVSNGSIPYIEVVSSWVPFDKTTIPGYLAASAIQTYASIYGGGWITSLDTNSMVIMVFFKLELEMLRIDCRNIFGEDGETINGEKSMRRLKNCHKRHVELCHFARVFDSCLSPIMLLYMFVCSVMLCVTAYEITIETSATQKFLTTEYLFFGIAQLFIYCWHSNDVLYMSQDLMLGPYESSWWSREVVKYRKDIFILTEQFRKNIVFSAGPFTHLTVPTFISILKGAYSYYTLLSKSQMK